MALGTDKAFIDKYRKDHKRGPKYPRFNLQAGDKNEQIFHLKLLPRLGPKSDVCDGPFHEFFVHFSSGPDQDQTLICLNTNRDEQKRNAKKCPGCSETKKIVSNKDDHPDKKVELAKKQSARARVNWPVYDLDKRREVEMLEISAKALDEILDEFLDSEGEYADLTAIKKHCCLQVKRKGSGFTSDYKYRAMFGQKYALDNEDAGNIKKSYMLPESVIERKDRPEFEQIWYGTFDTEEDGVVNRNREDKEEKTAREERQSGNALDDLDAGSGGSDAQEQPRQRQRSSEAESSRSRQRSRTKEPESSVDESDLMNELENLANQ